VWGFVFLIFLFLFVWSFIWVEACLLNQLSSKTVCGPFFFPVTLSETPPRQLPNTGSDNRLVNHFWFINLKFLDPRCFCPYFVSIYLWIQGFGAQPYFRGNKWVIVFPTLTLDFTATHSPPEGSQSACYQSNSAKRRI
jgi:hypothetical protein